MDESSPLLDPIGKQHRRWRLITMPVVFSRSQRKFITGVILLLCVVVLWTLSNFITSDLLSGGYDKPFLITYLNTSAFSLYLVPFLYKRRRRRTSFTDEHTYTPIPPIDTERPPRPPTIRNANSLIRSASPSPALIHQQPITPSHPVHPLPPIFSPPPSIHELVTHDKLSTRETASLAAVFCFAWFAANWSVNASLGLTSVGSSTILAGMSGFFTLGLGRMVGVESFTRAKILAVLASFIGLLLVTHSDSMISTASTVVASLTTDGTTLPDRRPKNALLGDGLALLSAICYAVYVILLKVKIEDEERVDMQLFFGFVGLFNTVFLLPVIPILHILGIESFHLPTRKEEWITCAVNMAITLSSDYLYVLSMLKTTPLVVTIGLSLTIPFAMAGDVLRGATSTITWASLTGAALVIVGFGLMGVEGWEEGMTNRVPLDAGVVALEVGEEEGSVRSSMNEEMGGTIEACAEGYRSRRPPASIRNE
ncbi:hypothetical protein NliqN6_1564 [Naganishia liquefaciens]|uniref:EamA domain-containing protein n=1 Tax=Naganishia liquefaciens TaxID=104408 RepID=A0A8H3TQ55_9TREE|nr:hypothetical protein NliqN6_1564 [Naganishia liquefaciens]